MTENNEKNTFSGNRDAREVMLTLIQTNRLHRKVIERYSDSLDLHCSAHRMLMHISRSENPPSQKELAEKLKISPAAVANTIKKLESDGYIERSKSKNGGDTRLNEITVTERGKIAAEDTEKHFREVDSSALSGFSDDELDTFVAMLERIQRNLTASEEQSSAENNRKEKHQ